MVNGSARVDAGRHSNGVRRLAYMEPGIRRQPERLPHPGGFRTHGPVRPNSRHFHLVRAWIVIFVISATAGAALVAWLLFCTKGN